MRWLTNMCSTSQKLKFLLTNSSLKWNVAILITEQQKKIKIPLRCRIATLFYIFFTVVVIFFQFFEYQKSLFTVKHEHAM